MTIYDYTYMSYMYDSLSIYREKVIHIRPITRSWIDLSSWWRLSCTACGVPLEEDITLTYI